MDPMLMLSGLEAGVAAVAPGWRISSWSPSAARLTGRPADEMLGQELWAALPALRRAPVEQAFTEVLADGNARTVRLPGRSAEGGPGGLEIEACRAADQHLLLLIRESSETGNGGTGEEASEIDEGARVYERLFDLLPIPALLLAGDGAIVLANGAASGLLAAPNAVALRGRPLTEWIRSHELAPTLRAAAGAPQRMTAAIEIPGGESAREAQLTIAAADPGSGSGRLVCLATEVSRELLLQRRLVQADRLSQLGALVSGVAHELNNPLAAIAAFAELLKDDARLPDLAESAGIIHAEAMRAGRMIRTLLDFAKQQPRTLQAVALPDVVDRVLALQRVALRKAGISSAVAFGSQLPSLRGDPRELQQVLLNAVVNARQAIVATGQPGRILITARPSDGRVVVSVEDTGAGVPTEILDRVFEPFFTTKGEEGTGLGLSISFGLIRAMGGRMWMQNIDGGGARLSFELPVEPEAAITTGEQPGVRATRPLTILVVEDQETVRRAIELMARRLGHAPSTVAGFAEAQQRIVDTRTGIDVFLVDVHLEEAHTGFELFDALVDEGRGRERLVVFTTGDSISPQTRDRLEQADRPVLRKPFALSELREVLERLG